MVIPVTLFGSRKKKKSGLGLGLAYFTVFFTDPFFQFSPVEKLRGETKENKGQEPRLQILTTPFPLFFVCFPLRQSSADLTHTYAHAQIHLCDAPRKGQNWAKGKSLVKELFTVALPLSFFVDKGEGRQRT